MITDLSNDGYSIIRGALSSALLDDLLDVLRDALSRSGKRTQGTLDDLIIAREAEDHGLIYSASNFVGSSLAAYRLITEVAPEVERMTGRRDLHVMPLTVSVQLPADSRFDYAWHQESAFHPWADEVINVWIPLQRPTRADTGTMFVIPGSHHDGKRDAQLYFSHEKFLQLEPVCTANEEGRQIPMELEVGDYVIFDGNLIHRSEPNGGDLPRMVAILRFISAAAMAKPRPLYKALSYEVESKPPSSGLS